MTTKDNNEAASADLIARIVDRDTPPDARNDVVDYDLRGNPITRGMVDSMGKAASAPDLFSAIMNLRADVSNCSISSAAADLSYKQGHRDARHAAAELVAASASQSSTAGAAKGGVTNDEFTAKLRRLVGSSHENFDAILAHVARQRQECPVAAQCRYPGEAWEACSLDEREAVIARGCEFRALFATPSAAVAEGVDTAELAAIFRALREAWSHDTTLAAEKKMRAYIAQQREAGRRIGVAQAASAVRERATLDDGVQDEIFVETAVEAIEALGEAARPSSDLAKLTTYRCSTSGMLAAPSGEYYLASDVRALSAAPPAKAEGMSDTARIEHLEAWLLEGKARGFHWNTFAFDTDKTVRAQLDTSREAYAQQAKGEQQP